MKNRPRKELEKDFLRLQNHFAEFVQRVAHDVQAPVKKILSFADLLEMKLPADLAAQAKEYLLRIESNSATLAKIIHQLREFAQFSLPIRKKERVDLNEALASAKTSLSDAIESAAPTLTAPPLPTVQGSKPQLTRLWQNLLNNALAYRREVPLKINIEAKKKKREWVFKVSDNGRGIPENDLDHIFKIFPAMSGKEGPATGIGLALCKHIVENHGGKIWCSSTPQQGSTFFFTLPN